MSELAGLVESVHFYVVKGAEPTTLNGYPTTYLTATPGGFTAGTFTDREIFVAAKDGDGYTVVTPRGWGREGQRVVYKGDRNLNALNTDVGSDGVLGLKYDNDTVLFDGAERQGLQEIEPTPVSLHGGVVMGVPLGASPESRQTYADFITSVIGREAVLMWNPDKSPRTLQDGTETAARAQDGYPYLITASESLAVLREREGTDATMDQFRPNIVITNFGGVEPDELGLFPEDHTAVYVIDGLRFVVESASNRCVVTNLRQGRVVGGGLRTIRTRKGVKLNERGEPIPGTEGNSFGVNASLDGESGPVIAKRSKVYAQERRQHPFVRLER